MTDSQKPRSSGISGVFRRLVKDDSRVVFKGMSTLAMGSAAGRFVGVLSIPVVTRLYSPEDFGVLSVFVAFTGILAPLVSLRFSQALPLPRTKTLALNLLALSLLMVFLWSGVVALLLWGGGPGFFRLLSMELLAQWWWLVVIAIIGRALYETFSLWATRMRAYTIMAKTSVWQSIWGAAAKVGLGLLGFQSTGLIIGQIVSQTSGIGTMVRNFLPDWKRVWSGVTFGRMRKVAWKYRDFPIYRVPSQFLMLFGMQAPMLFFAAFYDASTAGQFGLAMTSLSLPLNIVSVSAGRALYAEASAFHRQDAGRVVRVATDVRKKLFLIAIVPAGVLLFWGPEIFALVFGAEWQEAGRFASVLAFALAFQFATVPLVQLVNLISSQRLYLFLNLFRVILVLVIFAAGWSIDATPFQLILAFSLMMSVYYLVVSNVIIGLFK